ncbi:MAG: putative selenium-dependent hydroxylase accessory protein YqeC [Lachnospiraceae bacterium]|nr:putative selenium-dependent hydroxylase accessory protein YqeC [Lachnospiraceae bacterium]
MDISGFLKTGKGLTAIIGGGGKTTLLYTLAEELKEKGSIIICTSTHIRIPEQYPLITGGIDELKAGLPEPVICVGRTAENGKITAPWISFEELEGLADYVLVEADGARGLPLKAHAGHEPVIPPNAGKTVLVVGADGFGKKVKEVCHRPELWAEIAGVSEEDEAAPESEAEVIGKEGFGDVVFINKAETEEQKAAAGKMAALLKVPVIIGSLRYKEYREWP